MPKLSDDFIGNAATERWEAYGLDCAVVMNPMGTPNGYVRLPEGHPWWRSKKQCTDFNCERTDQHEHRVMEVGYEDIPVEVHGGPTYGPDEFGWIGFDTLHAGDFMPLPVVSPLPGVVWSVPMVKVETERLASQVNGGWQK